MTAAIYTARSGWNTILLDPAGGGGLAITTDMIHNYPGFPSGVSGQELMDRMAEQAKGFGAKIVWDEARSVSLEDGVFKVRSGGEDYLAKAVIYAAGTSPKRLGVPGEDRLIGKGVSFCATCDGALFRGKKVAVIGGGDSAMTEADFLTRFASEVILIHRRDEFRASLASVNRVRANPKVRFLLSSTVEEVRGDERVTSIVVLNRKSGTTSEIPVDGLFLYIGWEPNVKPVEGLVDLSESGFVKTNEDMTTKTPGLFAAGDIREKTLRQVATAVGDGAIAAWSAERYLQGH